MVDLQVNFPIYPPPQPTSTSSAEQSRAGRQCVVVVSSPLRAAPGRALCSQSGSVARGAAPGEPEQRWSGRSFEEILTQTAAGNNTRPDTLENMKL